MSIEVQLSSVSQSCPNLCNPMDCSIPGFSFHHQLSELAQLLSYLSLWCHPTISSSVDPFYSCLCPLIFLPSIFSSIRVFSRGSFLHIKWLKYSSFSFSISPSDEYQDWFPLGLTGWISFQSTGFSRVFSNTTVQKHQFLGAQLSLWSNFHTHAWLHGLYRFWFPQGICLEVVMLGHMVVLFLGFKISILPP